MSNRKVLTRCSFTVMATLLLLVSPLMYADDENKPDVDDGWGEWTALSKGYVARRKEPPKAMQQKAKETKLARLEGREKTNKSKEKSSKVLAANASVVQNAKKDKDETQDALWLRTREEGLYGVSVNDLAAALGESAKDLRRIAIKGEFSLTNAGEPVSWYFDASEDEFLFVGEVHNTFYTDENAYKFTQDREDSRPMAATEGSAIIGFGEERPFRDTLKFEQEPDYYFITWAVADEPDADYWFWDRLFGGYKDLIELELKAPNPALTGSAQIRVRLRGSSDMEPGDEHHVYAELNGERIGPVLTWDGFEERVLVADFDQGLLKPDGNNTLWLRNGYTPGEHPMQWLDDIELTYERLPIAGNGLLWLHDTVAGTQMVSGFTDKDILVIESPEGVSVMRNDALVEPDGHGGWAVTFDTSSSFDYLVVEGGGLQTPVLAPAAQSKIMKLSHRTDYLIIAPREFEGTAEALAAYRKSRFEHIGSVWLDEIYAEFSDGKVDPSAITRFMEWAKSQRISPSYVVLIGKGTVDQKDRMAYGDSFLPMMMTSTPWALAASDERLLASDGEASFAIGRLPITSDVEGLAYIQKLVEYESTIPGNERYEAVLVADNPDASGDFHANSDALSIRLLDTKGFDQVTTLYHPQDAVRASLIDSVTWETGYVSYDGHGSAAQVGDYREKFISSADAEVLQNFTYPVFTALTCVSGNYSLPGVRSLAGTLVLNPTGGAIASFAPTGLSLDRDAQLLGNAFVDSFFVSNTTIGDAVRDAKDNTSTDISAFMLSIYSVVGEPAIYARED